MNSFEELTTKYGQSPENAESMLFRYRKHIGEVHGDYVITDMTYIGDQTREIELTCLKCNTKRTKIFVNRRNKMCELATICSECEKRAKAERKLIEERQEKEKRRKQINAQIGKIYGDYELVGDDGKFYLAKCTTCGSEFKVFIDTVLQNKWKSTHCTKHYVQPVMYDESYIGYKNNMLEVIAITRDKNGKRSWVCKCDCGNITKVKPTIMVKGYVKSCGCYQENRSKDKDEIQRIKSIYRGMKKRCLDPADNDYYNYGGRGITICPEWLEDVDNFIEWSLFHGYKNTLTIDRIDNDKGYSPENCRWATYKVQNLNRRPRGKARNGKNNDRQEGENRNIAN